MFKYMCVYIYILIYCAICLLLHLLWQKTATFAFISPFFLSQFDCGSSMFRLCSTYISTVLDLYFDCARPMFRLCSTYFSTVLDLCFDCARPMFRLCSTYVSTVLDLCFDVLDLCFDCARPMFRLCSTYVSTVLDLCFDCARPMFRLCSTYASNLDMLRMCSASFFVFLDRSQLEFDFVLDFKMLLDCGFSVVKMHLLSFHSRSIFRATRPGNYA